MLNFHNAISGVEIDNAPYRELVRICTTRRLHAGVGELHWESPPRPDDARASVVRLYAALPAGASSLRMSVRCAGSLRRGHRRHSLTPGVTGASSSAHTSSSSEPSRRLRRTGVPLCAASFVWPRRALGGGRISPRELSGRRCPTLPLRSTKTRRALLKHRAYKYYPFS